MADKVFLHGDDLLAVSAETGEFTGIVLRDGDVITRKKENEELYINRGRAFVKMFPDAAEELCRRLSANGLYTCFVLLPYISRDSGILKKKNGAFLDIKYLCSKTGKSDKTIRRGMSELLKEGVLAKSTIKRRQAYIANPYVFQNGIKANATLLQLFDRSGWRRM